MGSPTRRHPTRTFPHTRGECGSGSSLEGQTHSSSVPLCHHHRVGGGICVPRLCQSGIRALHFSPPRDGGGEPSSLAHDGRTAAGDTFPHTRGLGDPVATCKSNLTQELFPPTYGGGEILRQGANSLPCGLECPLSPTYVGGLILSHVTKSSVWAAMGSFHFPHNTWGVG